MALPITESGSRVPRIGLATAYACTNSHFQETLFVNLQAHPETGRACYESYRVRCTFIFWTLENKLEAGVCLIVEIFSPLYGPLSERRRAAGEGGHAAVEDRTVSGYTCS